MRTLRDTNFADGKKRAPKEARIPVIQPRRIKYILFLPILNRPIQIF